MRRHPSDEILEAWRRGALEAAEAADIREHVDDCDGCRTRLAAEARFDRLLGRGLSRIQAPAGLREQLRSTLAAEAAARGARHRLPWRRRSLAAAAVAAAALGLTLLWVARAPAQRKPVLQEQAEPAAVDRIVRGQLVCIGCARHGAPVELHAACEAKNDPDHITGLRTPDGNLWRFAETAADEPLLADRRLRGTWVEVAARPYPEIGYLRVDSIRRL